MNAAAIWLPSNPRLLVNCDSISTRHCLAQTSWVDAIEMEFRELLIGRG
jgi:hypothetical protein